MRRRLRPMIARWASLGWHRSAANGRRNLLSNRRAHSTVVLALSSVPVLAIASFTFDYGMARVESGRLDEAAGLAARRAASAASEAYLSGAQDVLEAGIAAAKERFTAQTASQENIELTPLQVALSQEGSQFTVTVSYSASMSTSLTRMIGIDSLPISGHASASLTANPQVDIQLLLDTSSSMTFAATRADRAALEKLTAHFPLPARLPTHFAKGEACAFACHWSTTAPDFYQLAQKNHVVLRMSVLQEAVGNLIRTMGALDAGQRFQLGLYTFNRTFHTLQPLSRNLAAALQATAQIVPDAADCAGQCADTDFSAALAGLAAANAGLPRDAAAPQRFLMIVTDGVGDSIKDGRIGPVTPTDCNAIKAAGFTILVLCLPYPELPANALYNQTVAPIAGRVSPALQGCASSPGYFFEAADPLEINKKLQSMLRIALKLSSHPAE